MAFCSKSKRILSWLRMRLGYLSVSHSSSSIDRVTRWWALSVLRGWEDMWLNLPLRHVSARISLWSVLPKWCSILGGSSICSHWRSANRRRRDRGRNLHLCRTLLLSSTPLHRAPLIVSAYRKIIREIRQSGVNIAAYFSLPLLLRRKRIKRTFKCRCLLITSRHVGGRLHSTYRKRRLPRITTICL
ncbi:unnamed protein product [Haemonchus placei]|uniref:Secreted protein n=1 Tax=Haemonchus placei TaxID=6290 RepID=A0A0N4XA74_HAEPC|nr:unnamed protein product [Haemonchus placei]